MSDLQSLFMKNHGKAVRYLGQTVYMAYDISVEPESVIHLSIGPSDAKVFQGVSIRAGACNKQRAGVWIESSGLREMIPSGHLNLWKHSAPDTIVLGVCEPASQITVNNIWDSGDGVVHSWHKSAAMIHRMEGGKHVFSCSHGLDEVDFGDFQFSVEI